MPTPISSSTSSAPQPEAADAGPPIADGSRVVTVPPVYVEANPGHRDPSVQKLVSSHDAAKTVPNCRREAANATIGGIGIVGSVMATLGAAAAGGPIGFAGTIVGLLVTSYGTGQQLRSYYDCKNQ